MRLSAVIPAINEEAAIAVAISSAFAAQVDEVVVVDGGSADGTPQIAQTSGARVIVASAGRAKQMNAGARATTGEALVFLHADCRLPPAAGTQLRQVLERPGVVWGGFGQRIEGAGPLFRLLERGNALRARWRGAVYGDQGLFVRRAAFFEHGPFAEAPLLEDLMLSRVLRRVAWPVMLAGPLSVSARRWERNGVLRQTLRNWSILAAYACGFSPQSLAAWYRRHDCQP